MAHPGGRPTKYNEDLAKLICERVAINPLGLEAIINLYDDMPEHSTIKAWRKQYPKFSAWYNEAKSFQAQLLVEEIDQLIPGDIRYLVDEKGQERIDPPSASLLIAKINNRKWTAARLAPKMYGDQKQIEDLTASNQKMQEELFKLRSELDAKNKKEY